MFGAVIGVVGYGVWVDHGPVPDSLAATAAAGLVALGVLIAVRSMRLGVRCGNGAVRVRGLVLTRASIEDVTSFPALRWRDRAGRPRWTPIMWMAGSPRALDRYRAHNARELGRLRKWVDS